MSKRLASLLISTFILGASIFVTGCTNKEPGRYYNDEKAFSIVVPDDWQQSEDFMGVDFMAMSPIKNVQDTFSENMNVITEDLGLEISLEDYYTMSIQNLDVIMDNYTITEEGAATIGGQPAKYLKYDYEVNGLKIDIVTYLTMNGKQAYVLNFGASPDTAEEFKPIFDEMVASFRFE